MTLAALIDIFKEFWPVLPTIASGMIGWIAGKKKNAAEIQKLQTEIDAGQLKNVEAALSIYRDMVEDLSDQIGSYKNQVRELQRQNSELLVAMDKADKENQQLLKKIEGLQHLLKEYTNKKSN